MFVGVAKRCDSPSTVLSFAQGRRWRAAPRRALGLRRGEVVLDLAAGTAVSTVELAKSGAQAVAADFSLGMLRVGRARRPDLPFTGADAMRLPFADGGFDAVTMSFGLRNVVDVTGALSEFARVTKPGGRLVICEFSQPTLAPVRTAYREGVLRALPGVARRTASNPESYVYLADSIRDWPDQRALAAKITAAGWQQVQWRNLTGGIVALHRATR